MLPRWRWASAAGSSALSAVTNSRRVAVGASAARLRQTRTMLEARALESDADHAVAQLCPHRPCAADGEAGADHRVEECLPAGAGSAFVAVALGLLEGVVDGDREGRVRLLGEAVHRLRHAVEEECLRLLLAAVTVGRSDQLLGLGYGERGEEVGEDGLQRAAQPDVEEVGEVGVADVVVVGRVGGDDLVIDKTVCSASHLLCRACTDRRQMPQCARSYSCQRAHTRRCSRQPQQNGFTSA